MQPVDVMPGMVVAGAGAGLMMAQGTSVTMMSVSPEQSGAASGLSETIVTDCAVMKAIGVECWVTF